MLVADAGCRGKAVVLPPGRDGGRHGQAGGDQSFHLGVLDGEDGMAGGAQDLVGEGQGQADGAGDGAGGNVGVHVVLLSTVAKLGPKNKQRCKKRCNTC